MYYISNDHDVMTCLSMNLNEIYKTTLTSTFIHQRLIAINNHKINIYYLIIIILYLVAEKSDSKLKKKNKFVEFTAT